MAPVDSAGIDSVVPATPQLVATIATALVAAGAVIAVLLYCRRHRVAWPLLVLVSGTVTSLLEPLFDHLYGLWFFTQGQWTAFVTYGIHIPVWLPVIYVAYYGGCSVMFANRFSNGATMRDVGKLYIISVLLAALAEEFYINVFGLYEYQDNQPFVLFHYPVFVAFVNGVPPFLAGLVYFRLLRRLEGWSRLAFLGVVPVCFAADSFGSGFLYLAIRHLEAKPSMLVASLAALTAVAGSVGLIWTAAHLVGIPRTKAPVAGEETRDPDPALSAS